MRVDKWGVYAPKHGKVIAIPTSQSNYGNRIYIEYPDGYRTIHAHLKLITVQEGHEVQKGQLIGIMGDSGRGSRHLHFGLIPPDRPLKHLLVNCINPVPWLVDGGVYPCNTKVSGAFQELYGDYLHEGIDYSGLEKNLIDGWENGIEANTQRYYVYD